MVRERVRWAARRVAGPVAFVLSLVALPSGAQPPVPAGAEFQINTYTTIGQREPSVATDADGSFVVVWHSFAASGTDTSGPSIQGQRYASNGSMRGSQFQVNTYTTGEQLRASVATAPGGDFVVVWENNRFPASDIQGQRYASNGTPQGVEFQVNSFTTAYRGTPSIATAANGDFVVVWTDVSPSLTEASIQGRRFASNGSAQGTQFQVNSYTTSLQSSPSVAAAANGDFVVVWQSEYSLTDFDRSIQGQRYTSNGSVSTNQFQVNTYTTGEQGYPSVAASADGDFVVVWESEGSSGSDNSESSIQARRYASDGSAEGAEFQVNSYTTEYQWDPAVAAEADGDFVVAWESVGSSGTDTSRGIHGQRYASDGSTRGTQFAVNTYTTGEQGYPSVAASADGDFVVVWESEGSSGTDTSFSSIQAQRYRGPIVAPAMSPATRFALGTALLLLGAAYGLRRRA